MKGPSPRGRGNHRGVSRLQERAALPRSIPAWAGKPKQGSSGSRRRRVHPRVGGETTAEPKPGDVVRGPSPRGRGNPLDLMPLAPLERSIPAWAGKPSAAGGHSGRVTVHPRVGGETPDRVMMPATGEGPSPRGRGNRGRLRRRRRRQWSIPAWAGKPVRRNRYGAALRVHPRVGGETVTIVTEFGDVQGPSPRGRGKPEFGHRARCSSRVHPRVGGETAGSAPVLDVRPGPSPRGRGNRYDHSVGARPLRSIPAWAGKPVGRRRCTPIRRVHPRVGGETHSLVSFAVLYQGPSPRGRGNRVLVGKRAADSGSIPAWAGKPLRCGHLGRGDEVHPRVGGETQYIAMVRPYMKSPSPRGRGNRCPGTSTCP